MPTLSILQQFFLTRKAIGVIINTFYFNLLFDNISSIVRCIGKKRKQISGQRHTRNFNFGCQHKWVFSISTTIIFSHWNSWNLLSISNYNPEIKFLVKKVHKNLIHYVCVLLISVLNYSSYANQSIFFYSNTFYRWGKIHLK